MVLVQKIPRKNVFRNPVSRADGQSSPSASATRENPHPQDSSHYTVKALNSAEISMLARKCTCPWSLTDSSKWSFHNFPALLKPPSPPCHYFFTADNFYLRENRGDSAGRNSLNLPCPHVWTGADTPQGLSCCPGERCYICFLTEVTSLSLLLFISSLGIQSVQALSALKQKCKPLYPSLYRQVLNSVTLRLCLLPFGLALHPLQSDLCTTASPKLSWKKSRPALWLNDEHSVLLYLT